MSIKDAIQSKKEKEEFGHEEGFYYRIVENANDIIQSIDFDGKIVYVNKKWKEVLGYNAKETKGMLFTDILRGDQLDRCHKIFEELVFGKENLKLETVFLTKNNKEIYVEGTLNAILREGKMVSTIGIFRDITERKEIEETLKNSEEKWRSLVENSPDFILNIDEEGKILFINRVPYIRDLTPKKAIGKNFYSFVPAEYHNTMRKTFKEGFKGSSGSYESKGVGPGGDTSTWYKCRVEPVLHDGKVSNLCLIMTDITESKKMTEKLKESEERFRTIFENVSDQIVYLNKYGKIIDVNERIEDILGYKKSDVVGKNFAELKMLSRKEAPKLVELFGQIIKGKPITNMEMKVKRKSGQFIFIEVSTRLVVRENNVEGLIALIKDVTERKQAEEGIKKSYERLKERTDELVRVNKHLMGRENRILELKEEIKKIKEEN